MKATQMTLVSRQRDGRPGHGRFRYVLRKYTIGIVKRPFIKSFTKRKDVDTYCRKHNLRLPINEYFS